MYGCGISVGGCGLHGLRELRAEKKTKNKKQSVNEKGGQNYTVKKKVLFLEQKRGGGR